MRRRWGLWWRAWWWGIELIVRCQLASKIRAYLNPINYRLEILILFVLLELGYPKSLELLAVHIDQTQFLLAFRQFLHQVDHPDSEDVPSHLENCPPFFGKIHVHHSAMATFYSPSDLFGVGGMLHEHIRSNPSFKGQPRYDTVFVVLDEEQPGMHRMVIAYVRLFFYSTIAIEIFLVPLLPGLYPMLFPSLIPTLECGLFILSVTIALHALYTKSLTSIPLHEVPISCLYLVQIEFLRGSVIMML